MDDKKMNMGSRTGGNALHVSVMCILAVFCAIFFMIPGEAVSSGNGKMKEQIETFMLDNYPWSDIEVSNVRMIGKERADDPVSVTMEKGPLGHAVFSFRYADGGRRVVKADVTAYARIVKSRRPFRRNHVIMPGDLYEDRIDVRKMPGSAVQSMDRLIGKTLKRSIVANIPIVEEMVEMSRVVKRGSRVMLLLDEGGIRISTIGKIREKGYVGRPVRAINLSSNKEVIGILVDESTVRVGM